MAFPKDLDDIVTNLDPAELRRVVAAVEGNQVDWIKESVYLFAADCAGDFLFDGKRYSIFERFETVIGVLRR